MMASRAWRSGAARAAGGRAGRAGAAGRRRPRGARWRRPRTRPRAPRWRCTPRRPAGPRPRARSSGGGRPGGADGVELVEVEQAGRARPGRLEDLMDAAAAVAEPHVDHVRQVDPEEAGPQLAGQRPGQVRLAAAGRPVHQQAAAERAPEQPAHARVAQRRQEGRGQPPLDRRHAADVGQGRPRLLDLAQHPLVHGRPRCWGSAGAAGNGAGAGKGLSGRGRGGPLDQLGGLALAGDEGEHGRAVLERLGGAARLQQQRGDVQAQGQVVGHGLDRRPQTGKQLRIDRHGGNSMAIRPPSRRRNGDYSITMSGTHSGGRRR